MHKVINVFMDTVQFLKVNNSFKIIPAPRTAKINFYLLIYLIVYTEASIIGLQVQGFIMEKTIHSTGRITEIP